MKSLKYFVLLLIIASCNSNNPEKESEFVVVPDDVNEPVLPDAPRWISDEEQLFTIEDATAINQLSDSVFNTTACMIMIGTVRTYEPYVNFNDYTAAIDAAWADQSQNYLIILISDELMEVRVVQGEVVEKNLPLTFTDDVIQDILVPHFRSNDYAGGIKNAIQTYGDALK